MLVVLREQTDPSDYAACRVARVARIAAMRWPRHTKASACINSQFRPSSSLSDQQPKDERWLRAEFLPPLEFGPPLATARITLLEKKRGVQGDSESVNQPPVASQTAPVQQPHKERPGPGERSAIVFGYLALTVAVVAVVGRRATADGTNIAALELAGSSDRVSMLRGDVPIDVLDRAIAWDFVFIACYSALLIIASLYFAPRAFRLQAFRNFAHTALVLTAVGAGLDGLENAFTLFGLYYPGTDLPWQAAATASWAKWITIAVVAFYAAVAMATYLITPAWVSTLLLKSPEPNVRMTPTEAAKPEAHVKSGTPGTQTERVNPACTVRNCGLRRWNPLRVIGFGQPATPGSGIFQAG